jgi:hypothetical protein
MEEDPILSKMLSDINTKWKHVDIERIVYGELKLSIVEIINLLRPWLRNHVSLTNSVYSQDAENELEGNLSILIFITFRKCFLVGYEYGFTGKARTTITHDELIIPPEAMKLIDCSEIILFNLIEGITTNIVTHGLNNRSELEVLISTISKIIINTCKKAYWKGFLGIIDKEENKNINQNKDVGSDKGKFSIDDPSLKEELTRVHERWINIRVEEERKVEMKKEEEKIITILLPWLKLYLTISEDKINQRNERNKVEAWQNEIEGCWYDCYRIGYEYEIMGVGRVRKADDVELSPEVGKLIKYTYGSLLKKMADLVETISNNNLQTTKECYDIIISLGHVLDYASFQACWFGVIRFIKQSKGDTGKE